jgi:hypothetical protein
MMKREIIAIADIYVPVKRRATLDQKRVDEIAASVLDKSQQTPILVRYLACDLLFQVRETPGIISRSNAQLSAAERSSQRTTSSQIGSRSSVRIGVDLGGTKIEIIALDDKPAPAPYHAVADWRSTLLLGKRKYSLLRPAPERKVSMQPNFPP